MDSLSTSVVSAAKLPILNPNEFDLLKMRIKKYFLMTDYSLWEVIINGDSHAPTVVIDGVVQPVTILSADQKLARRNHFVDKDDFEIKLKQLQIDNDQLLNQIMSQEIIHIAMNSGDISYGKNLYVDECNLNAQLQEKVLAIAALKNELRELKGKNVVDTAVSKPTAAIAPGMFKLNLEPLAANYCKTRTFFGEPKLVPLAPIYPTIYTTLPHSPPYPHCHAPPTPATITTSPSPLPRHCHPAAIHHYPAAYTTQRHQPTPLTPSTTADASPPPSSLFFSFGFIKNKGVFVLWSAEKKGGGCGYCSRQQGGFLFLVTVHRQRGGCSRWSTATRACLLSVY
nr:hypothetical protein [Tanacetum cinerariifolium]